MSLFFLILTAVTFAASHWMARQSQPDSDSIYQKNFLFAGTKGRFSQKVHSWVENSSSLLFIHENGNEFVIQRNSSLFSYGYFYHIKLVPLDEDSSYQVKFQIQAKLISSTKEESLFSKDLMSFLELKEEIDEDAA